MTPGIVVVGDPAESAAELIAEAASRGANIALTGGSTSRAAYEQLAAMDVEWGGTSLWFTDERCVSADHEHSNYGMVKAALLDRIAGASAHRMEGELGPQEAAARYESALRDLFQDERPEFDLVLLGLGPDAHVCSLFPGDPALDERERWVVPVEAPGMAPLVSRVTLTLPVVNAARAVVFLVTGEDKAEAVSRSFSESPDPDAPGSLVRPDHGSLTVLLDDSAAIRL